MQKGIIGKKLGMTQLFDENGKVVPVTIIEAGPCVVVQKKTVESDGYQAVQLGYGDVSAKRVTKPAKGHFDKADVAPKKTLREFRLDDISGLAVAALIVVMGVELLISSVDKILSPEPVEVGLLPAAILLASILVKLYMFAYNCSVGKKISSSAMAATGADSLSDSVATAVVLLSMGVSWLFKVNIDGWAGAAVAVFILFAGYGVAKDTLSPLLGQAPDPELVKSIEEIVMSSDAVIGMHDLVVHDYGPGRMMISLHAEVDGRGDIFQLHDSIDTVERELKSALGCDATIHMDPVETDNEQVNAERAALEEALKGIDGLRGIHDFRMVMGPSHTNLIFDVVMDTGCGKTPEQFRDIICRTVEEKLPGHFAVVTVDTSFVF